MAIFLLMICIDHDRIWVEKNLIQSMKVKGSEIPDIQKIFMNVLKIYVLIYNVSYIYNLFFVAINIYLFSIFLLSRLF